MIYRDLTYFILKLLAWWICTMKFAKKSRIESQLTIKVNVWYEIACIRRYNTNNICYEKFVTHLLLVANVWRIFRNRHYVKKSVQLVRGSSFRNDLLQNPYLSTKHINQKKNWSSNFDFIEVCLIFFLLYIFIKNLCNIMS